MSLQIPANETGVIRVFALSMSTEKARALKAGMSENNGNSHGGSLRQLLGGAALDASHVELFALADLGDMALADYLVEGAGAEPKVVEPDRLKLSALDGWVMIVYSSAFLGMQQVLTPTSELRLIGTYAQEGTDWGARIDLSTPSARPRGSGMSEPAPKKRPSDAAMSGRIAMLALLVAFAVVGLMLWVGS